MYKKNKKHLKSFLNNAIYNDEMFSRSSMNTIIRALLEPVANQNAVSLMFTRLKNKEGLSGLIKRLEYCNNVEMVDVSEPDVLITDDYIELEFIIFTSARYNFALLFDYSMDSDKNYTKAFFLANSRGVNDVYEVLQANMNTDYREKFYLHKPERRENELLNEAMFNVFKKLNNSIEENAYKSGGDLFIDLSDEEDSEEKIKETSHEIKNQLSVIDVYLSILEKQNGENKNINTIKKALSNIQIQLNELKNYADVEIKEINLQDLINESVQIFGEIVKQNGNKIEFINSPSYDINVFADENKLLSVINNIIKNSNEATKNDAIVIELSTDKNFAILDITNHGDIIPIEYQKTIFEKGFTTKQKGSGIGLYSSRNFIENMKGTLELFESTLENTTFRIKLPII